MNENKNNFTPKFFSPKLNSFSNSANPINKRREDMEKINHLHKPVHSSNSLKTRPKIQLATFSRNRPGSDENKVDDSAAIYRVRIDWTKHESVMSDGSRIRFGEKLSKAEVRYDGNIPQ